ncbi:anthranilate synthase component I family protein [Companilactobacillus sp.]|jgi:anthranilate synthase component 1|uniref:anthranilate synthase component I family protein n=1 Tax=Companilactobacillus sp. TaxID=2767905 RepID=UPI0025B7C76D|nr:anthranilate synthase component I family protein [Companilactobacillus sp.]MCH4009030.1 anthranilate synthase component I family protein [Companilactobacillus sp.]MCH4050791.1 anthranilate synthase component I family protein [Companilactobacillus sp.]MCH4076972.1 anthranilate synthase component I family protein [Companilactobacillus sp.]MCH4125548.1 anthranilate synthase component I family protein [Companilactobacillus sp.]MCI1311257.1 anthranilate synthase component I family protein [Compa
MKINDLKKYTNDYPAVPVTISFKLEDFDPIDLTQNLNQSQGPCFLFTGQPKPDEDGYSFIGLNPDETIVYKDGTLTVEKAGKITQTKTALKPYLESILTKYRTPKFDDLPPFLGGLAGYLSYDYARFANPTLPQKLADPYGLNDADFLLIHKVIAYNHKTQTVTLSKIVSSKALETDYDDAISELNELKEIVIANNHPSQLPGFKMLSKPELHFDREEFAEKVADTKKHIVDGDIFQLILSNPQHGTMSGSLYAVTKNLFKDSPAPYQFFYKHNDFETVGSSPETLISKHDDKLFTYPLAGTRRRGKTPEEDAQLAYELTHSTKELSEHNMLIDLGRNDLGRVSKFGTVKVTRTRKLLHFSNVMHMGSTVESIADPQESAVDIVESLMPAGTLSGAPKISAMKIISNIEGQKRGIYGGCLGYFDFSGDLDFCIGIRLAYRQNENLVVHSGAGIVADSIAKNEYQEFNNKARNVVDALNKTNQTEVLS